MSSFQIGFKIWNACRLMRADKRHSMHKLGYAENLMNLLN